MDTISKEPDEPASRIQTILIIDDEITNLGVLSNYLEEAGYQVLTARDGESGLQKAQYARPDLILLDVILSGIDGFETCRRLKADKTTKDIPVIFITILEDTADKVKGFAAGGVDYIPKPFQQEEVLARLSIHLRLRSLTRALEEAKASLEKQVKARTKALQISEARYRALYQDNPSMFFTLDAEGTVVSVNTFGASQLGYTIEELEGQSVLNVFYEEDQEAVTTRLQHCLQNPWQTEIWQFRKVRKDGSLLWAEEFARAVEGPEGDVQILVVCQNITDRKQAELEREQLLAQIREQAQQMQNIIDTVPEGVLLLSADAQVRMTNPTAEQYLALLAPDWCNGRLAHLGSHPLNDLLTSPPKGLWHDVSANGRRFEVIARPVENGPTNQGWVLVLRDVTQERAIQRRVQEQERLAAVGQLAAGIAHDFNNILAVISLYSQITLRTVALSPRVQERMQTIDQQAKRASDLIEQILDFSRQSIMNRQPLDLLSFLKNLAKLLKRTLPENIHQKLVHAEDTYVVFADSSRLQQVFMNLAVNARDAMPEGGDLTITLDTLLVRSPSDAPLPGMSRGKWIQIAVTDSGAGINSEMLSRIFEPFFTTKEVGQGTGLGLAQVYGIVQQHQGLIDVRSEVRQGTTFLLYFPAYVAEWQEVPEVKPDALPKGEGQMILLVEDEMATRQALAESLTILNYTVIEARNGREALTLLQQHNSKIDLILSDAVMPEMGGISLLHSVRQLEVDIPFVVITGHVIEKDMEALRTQGLSAWLVKPPDLAELAGLLAQLLAR
jgi:two-component system, cell cycle sensor histidine kinase and response regulator CckA